MVIGIDESHGVTYIHDPFFAQASVEMSLIEFEAGWIEGEGYYAVIIKNNTLGMIRWEQMVCLGIQNRAVKVQWRSMLSNAQIL